MSSDQSRLTQSFLALDDKDFNAIPVLNKVSACISVLVIDDCS
jgi:hypothetical protein